MMHVKVKFVEGFKDGTIFSDRSFGVNEVAVITEAQLEQVRRSGGNVEVLENVIKNPLKREPVEVKREDMADPQNKENSINNLDTHVAGYEEELEEGRAKEMKERAKKAKK